uniref:Uncharacterized protein n=1 Tax=Ixodes ricinus TaxID=34613 RepID=A0A6B0URW4_IXORI
MASMSMSSSSLGCCWPAAGLGCGLGCSFISWMLELMWRSEYTTSTFSSSEPSSPPEELSSSSASCSHLMKGLARSWISWATSLLTYFLETFLDQSSSTSSSSTSESYRALRMWGTRGRRAALCSRTTCSTPPRR